MPNLSISDKLAYASQVIGVVQSSLDLFTEQQKSYVSEVLGELQQKLNDASAATNAQKVSQKESNGATVSAREKRDRAYDATVNLVRLTESILGRDHYLVRKLRTLAESFSNPAARGKEHDGTEGGQAPAPSSGTNAPNP